MGSLVMVTAESGITCAGTFPTRGFHVGKACVSANDYGECAKKAGFGTFAETIGPLEILNAGDESAETENECVVKKSGEEC